jgi:hypothetical protein
LILCSVLWARSETIFYAGELTTANLLFLLPTTTELSLDDLSNIKKRKNRWGHYIKVKRKTLFFEQRKSPEDESIKTLLYSNHPETVKSFNTVLFNKKNRGAARVFFFHKNGMGSNGYLKLEIESPKNYYFYLHGGIGGPDLQELFVGQLMAKRFWENSQNGFFFKRTFVKQYPIKAGMVAGGMIDLIPFNKEIPYAVRLSFVRDIKTNIRHSSAPVGQLYPLHTIDQTVAIKNKYKIYNTRFGATRLLEGNGHKLEGNYGVDYLFNFDFKKEGHYSLYFNAHGGPAGLVGKLGDQILQVYSKGESKKLIDIIVNQPRQVQLRTIPLAGSNYPVSVTVKRKR